jgi:23S rRNA-/tRNA-specific pseudouridylate synthase
MAAIGHPVVGDARYGTPERALGSGRFFLHAFRLEFTHPATGERMDFSAPLPDDLGAFLGSLMDAEDVGVEGEGG